MRMSLPFSLFLVCNLCLFLQPIESRLFAFVANSTHIVTFETNPTNGSLTPLSSIAQPSNSAWISTYPSTNPYYLLATGVDTIAVFTIGNNGALSARNTVNSSGQNPAYISWDQKGEYALVANYGKADNDSTGASLAVFPVSSGLFPSLGDPTAVIHHSGNGTNPDRQTGPHPHMIATDYTNQFVFNTDLGTDKTYQYLLRENGTLVPNNVSFVTPSIFGDGPRHFAIHPSHLFSYVINEMGNSIDVFLYDQKLGQFNGPIQSVSTLPEDFNGSSTAAEIVLTPNGKYLYASNRGYDSIVSYYVDPTQTDFHLKRIGFTTYRISTPRNFAIDPSGNLLLVGASTTAEIVSFTIHPDSGLLTPTGAVTSMSGAICIQFNEGN